MDIHEKFLSGENKGADYDKTNANVNMTLQPVLSLNPLRTAKSTFLSGDALREIMVCPMGIYR